MSFKAEERDRFSVYISWCCSLHVPSVQQIRIGLVCLRAKKSIKMNFSITKSIHVANTLTFEIMQPLYDAGNQVSQHEHALEMNLLLFGRSGEILGQFWIEQFCFFNCVRATFEL